MAQVEYDLRRSSQRNDPENALTTACCTLDARVTHTSSERRSGGLYSGTSDVCKTVVANTGSTVAMLQLLTQHLE